MLKELIKKDGQDLTNLEIMIKRIDRWLKRQNRSNIVGFNIIQNTSNGSKTFFAEWPDIEVDDNIIMIYDSVQNTPNMECILSAFMDEFLQDAYSRKNKLHIKLMGDNTAIIEPVPVGA